jgi:very-short-patch-repair endonuclease
MSYKYETAAPDRYDLLKTFAKYNRREMTQSETILWKALRHELRAYRFRRQHPIGDYIADFACNSEKLVIELDGGYHNTEQRKEADMVRDAWLKKMGYKVLHFTNEELFGNINKVIIEIKNNINIALPFSNI